MAKTYGNESISALKGADRVRKKPEVMLTTRTIEGARHTVIEMLGNGIDEAEAGYGSEFELDYFKDHSVRFRDYGRGVPLGWNEKEGRYNWDLIYNEMYAGGKYEDIDESVFSKIDINNLDALKSFAYLFPIGTNGLGGFATQASSKFFEVKSYHNEVHGDSSTPMVCSRMKFEEGIPIMEELEVTPTTEKMGTEIHWKPDCDEVFIDAKSDDLDFDWILRYCKEIAYIKGYTFRLYNEETGERHEIIGRGITELLRDDCGKKLVDDNILYKENWKKGVVNTANGSTAVRYLAKTEIALAFTEDKVKTVCYHNSTRMLRGVTYTAVDIALDKFFSERASEYKVRLQSSDYNSCVSAVVSTYSTTSSFENQTKQGVTNGFLLELVSDTVYNMLNVEYGKGNKVLKKIITDVVERANTRIRIKQYEKQQREASRLSRTRKKAEKLVDCKWTEPERIELHITEGDSASGALEKARDARYQAILPIIGKFINCLKQGMDKILACKVIQNIFSTLGCGMDLPGSDLFDITRLKYANIYIDTDADADGAQIQMICFAMFYTLAPELLRQGRVHITLTPLFENVLLSGQSIFAYNEKEQKEILEKYKGSIRTIHRSKGLGENDPDMLWDTTLNPETRRVITLKIDSRDRDCEKLIDCMFGKDRNGDRKTALLSMLGSEMADMFSTVEVKDEIDVEE